MLRVAVCLAILRAVSTTSTACDPYSFSDLDHDLVCGPCLVLADNMQSFTNCSAYCEAQGLGCVNGWEEYADDCMPYYEVGCDTTVAWPTTSYYYEANPHSYGRGYGGTSDALCECGTTSQGFFDEDFSYMYEVSSETPCYAICTQFPFIRGLTCEGRATGGCGDTCNSNVQDWIDGLCLWYASSYSYSYGPVPCSLTDSPCSYAYEPTPAPTPILTPVPTPTPAVAVALELGMTGLSCSAYGAAEEAVINMALERSIPGTDAEDSFSAHICTDIARRVRSRSLLTSSGVSIEVTASVVIEDFVAAADDDLTSATDAHTVDAMAIILMVTETITTAVSSGAMGAAVEDAASATVVHASQVCSDQWLNYGTHLSIAECAAQAAIQCPGQLFATASPQHPNWGCRCCGSGWACSACGNSNVAWNVYFPNDDAAFSVDFSAITVDSVSVSTMSPTSAPTTPDIFAISASRTSVAAASAVVAAAVAVAVGAAALVL